MLASLTPAIFRPDFTWPRPVPCTISETTPAVPHVSGRPTRIAWGVVHKVLYYFSRWYCSWFGIAFDVRIVQLPFGLVIKWTDRTSVEEAVSTQMARAAGIPTPKVLNYGEHPKDPFNRKVSILMTRLPGISLENSRDELQADAEGPWLAELRQCMRSMRLWLPPNPRAICSPIGTSLRSPRVPNHIMGPFADHMQLLEYLLSPASLHGFKTMVEYEDAMARAKRLQQRPHRITFTHGDFKAHNILLGEDGHLSGLLDWESAGWYPEYWDFTTAMRFGRGSWWFQVASWIGGNQYLDELDSDIALNLLTVDSYIAI